MKEYKRPIVRVTVWIEDVVSTSPNLENDNIGGVLGNWNFFTVGGAIDDEQS